MLVPVCTALFAAGLAQTGGAAPAPPAARAVASVPAPDVAGDWYFTGRPLEKTPRRFGRAVIRLTQHGTELSGRMWMSQNPNQPEPTPPGEDRRQTESAIAGRLTLSPDGRGTLVTLRRLVDDSGFAAIFTGTLNAEGNVIDGWFVNNNPGRGACRIARGASPELPIADYQENLADARRLQIENGGGSADETAILALADRFERGLTTRDEAEALAPFVNRDVPFVGPGDAADELNAKTIGAFVSRAVAGEPLIEETLSDRRVIVRGDAAVLICDYDYRVDGESRGAGVEVWTLTRTAAGWRVLAASFSK